MGLDAEKWSKEDLITYIDTLQHELSCVKSVTRDLIEDFPLFLGQDVYKVTLRNSLGELDEEEPSFEHSTITMIIVDKQNYFELVEKYKQDNLFTDKTEAEDYIRLACEEF